MNELSITMVQADLVWENPEANRKKIEALLSGHQFIGDLILLPEMFSTGFSMNPAPNAEPMEGPTSAWMMKLAKQYNAVLGGSLIISEQGKFYNRFIAMGPDGSLAQYNKRHLFRMANEQEHYAMGTERIVFEWKGWRILPQVCYDLRFPAFARNQFSDNGTADYDLLVYVANWPVRRIHHWKTLLNARAIENQCYVSGLNRVGSDENGFYYSGESAIIDFGGNVLASSAHAESVFSCTLFKSALEEYRKAFPAWQDADAFRIQP